MAQDRRIARTRRALQEALIALIVEKGYEAITVQDILDRADVGRSTFYLHFEDKEHLLAAGFAGLREMLEESLRASPVAGRSPAERALGFTPRLFEHAYEYRSVFHAVGGSGGTIVRRHFQETLAGVIQDQLRTEMKKRQAQALPPDLAVHFAASALVSVISWWLIQKDPAPPAEIDAIFRQLVLPGMKAALG